MCKEKKGSRLSGGLIVILLFYGLMATVGLSMLYESYKINSLLADRVELEEQNPVLNKLVDVVFTGTPDMSTYNFYFKKGDIKIQGDFYTSVTPAVDVYINWEALDLSSFEQELLLKAAKIRFKKTNQEKEQQEFLRNKILEIE